VFYILYIITDDGRGYFMRRFVKRKRDIGPATSYWMVPIKALEKGDE
jgi:hypothetical protein